jgi:large subunit ribosomal protein L9
MPTEIILLERVENLGQMGDVVKVRPGYARNFLLPQKKALRATKSNLAYFEGQRKALETANQKKKDEASAHAGKLNGLKVVVVRQASEAGHLYGSVTTRDIAEAISATGLKVDRSQVVLNQAIKEIGLLPVAIQLHPEVKVNVTLNIARSEEEAKQQEKSGKALIVDHNARDAAEEQAAAPAEAEAEQTEQAAKPARKKAAKKADDAEEAA